MEFEITTLNNSDAFILKFRRTGFYVMVFDIPLKQNYEYKTKNVGNLMKTFWWMSLSDS